MMSSPITMSTEPSADQHELKRRRPTPGDANAILAEFGFAPKRMDVQ